MSQESVSLTWFKKDKSNNKYKQTHNHLKGPFNGYRTTIIGYSEDFYIFSIDFKVKLFNRGVQPY